MCLNSPTLPFLPCFIAFCSTHSYTSYFYEIFATCSNCDPPMFVFQCQSWPILLQGYDMVGIAQVNTVNWTGSITALFFCILLSA